MVQNCKMVVGDDAYIVALGFVINQTGGSWAPALQNVNKKRFICITKSEVISLENYGIIKKKVEWCLNGGMFNVVRSASFFSRI